MESAIATFVHGWKADKAGNLVFRWVWGLCASPTAGLMFSLQICG